MCLDLRETLNRHHDAAAGLTASDSAGSLGLDKGSMRALEWRASEHTKDQPSFLSIISGETVKPHLIEPKLIVRGRAAVR